jgi:formylglycine-generating enzyme required for sulfatase activity
MQKFQFQILLISFFLIFSSPAYANNLVISNVTLEDRNPSANTVVVQFNISWDHSWRKNDGRHDAAWVFFKIRDDSNGSAWYHAKLYTAGTNPADSSPGSNADVKIVVPSDKTGAFISRQATGNGTFSSKKVRVTLDYNSSGFISDNVAVSVKAFGIEMVYIPEGPFYIGDGNGTQEGSNAFHLNGVDNTAVQITTTGKVIVVDSPSTYDDATLTSTGVTVTGLAGITGNTSWPNGYDDFYLMKYELTQGQYVDFLNTLSRLQQGNRVAATVSANTIANYYVMTNGTSVASRQGVRAPASGNGTSPTTVVFGNDFNANGTLNESDDGQSIAMNYISWTDFVAYADWAGLRPTTELEFEKACRGTNSAVYGELAWGTTLGTQVLAVSNSGRANEISVQSGKGLSNYDDTAASTLGPIRVGFAATNSTNRVSSGAGYFGNMELSGNLLEYTVALGVSAGRAFTGTAGDGTLTTTASFEGNATNTDWPGINATTARGVTGGTGKGERGGGWSVALSVSQVSSRLLAGNTVNSRSNSVGGRCARTAP